MIDCISIVNKIKEEIKNKVSIMDNPPHLCVIQIGNDPASNAYIKGKANDCNECGIMFTHERFEDNITKDEIILNIRKKISSNRYTHMMIQLPIPFNFEDTKEIINTIPTYMDVDGLVEKSDYTPCTSLGIMKILEKINYDLDGKNVLIINRSELVGRPLVNLMLDKNATVSICHSHTKNLQDYINIADVIICAVGKENFLGHSNGEYVVFDNQCIIDVGINRDENGKLCGDCSRELYDYVDLITPTPKGSALFTRAMLLENIIK